MHIDLIHIRSSIKLRPKDHILMKNGPNIEEEIYIEEETKIEYGEELNLQKEMLQVDSFEDFQKNY